mgnify:CR=1 FL=1|tara:strand:+ start:414 stop:611 length:198 start_codon:yes stop_codon:yes gene_type:complete
MKLQQTLKQRAIEKVIACIDSSKNYEHLSGCKRMIELLYDYNIRKRTLSYIMLKYRAKKQELYHE